MALTSGMTREVLDVVDAYVRYYNERNPAKVLALFSKEVSGFGTGKDEIVLNIGQFRDRLRVDFDPKSAVRVSVKVLATGGTMPAAWVTGLCTFSGTILGERVRMEGRVTAVLMNRGGRWLFEQVHFSVPAP